jgi:hypothetical protein
MSNYTKTVDFAAKDALPSGNAGKIIKGEDIDDQFNAIATAIASKSDSNTVPTLSGNNTLSGTNTFTGAMVKSASVNDQAYFGATPVSYSEGGVTATGILSGVTTASTKVGVVAQTVSSGGIAAAIAVHNTASYLVNFGYTASGYVTVGYIATTGSSTSYATSSDYRLKENVATLTGAVDRVKQLNPVRFNWINNPGAGTVDGFLAHEVTPVVPEAVVGQKDETHADGSIKAQGIDQSKLVPLLVAAVKELTARVEALEAN